MIIKYPKMKNNAVSALIIFLLAAFTLGGCMESHYFRQNNRHSDGYQRRHMDRHEGERRENRK